MDEVDGDGTRGTRQLVTRRLNRDLELQMEGLDRSCTGQRRPSVYAWEYCVCFFGRLIPYWLVEILVRMDRSMEEEEKLVD